MFETLSAPSPLETQLAALCAELSGLHFTQAADDDVDLQVLTRHDLLGVAALVELSGWELADLLRDLPPVADVDGWTVIEMLKGLAKLERFVQAQKVRVLADLGERRYDVVERWSHHAAPATTWIGTPEQVLGDDIEGEMSRHAAVEVALALGIPRLQAKDELLDAFTMSRRLPQVVNALAAGTISGRAATTLNENTLTLAPDLAVVAADRVLARPEVVTVPQTRAAIRAAVIAVDPTAARRREVKALTGRTVDAPHRIEDGMGHLVAYLPAPDLVTTYEQLSALAEATRSPDDTRTAGARRADVLVDLIAGRPILTPDGRDLRSGDGRPVAPAKAWRIDVVVAATTLIGADDNPGRLVGYGPITAESARYLAALTDDPQWNRILTDPESGLTRDYGTTRYRPPDSLAGYIRARDGRCYLPTCSTPAYRCDIDHLKNSPAGPSPRPDPGGVTADTNLAPGCRPDHTTKGAPGWNVDSPSPGTFIWTTPTGHTYTRHPEPPLDDGGGPSPTPRPPPEAALPPDTAPPGPDAPPPF